MIMYIYDCACICIYMCVFVCFFLRMLYWQEWSLALDSRRLAGHGHSELMLVDWRCFFIDPLYWSSMFLEGDWPWSTDRPQRINQLQGLAWLLIQTSYAISMFCSPSGPASPFPYFPFVLPNHFRSTLIFGIAWTVKDPEVSNGFLIAFLKTPNPKTRWWWYSLHTWMYRYNIL